MTGRRRTNMIAELIGDGLYPVDPRAISEAMWFGATARRVLPGFELRGEDHRPPVRSFHAARGAPSFRLAGARR